jgi:sporulation protein YlmC with PRC-barrel domain
MHQLNTAVVESMREWRGLEVFDRDGERVGKLVEIYVEEETGRPEFALVRTGLFRLRSSFVPIGGAFTEEGALVVQVEKAEIREAPALAKDTELDPELERQVYEHYGFEYPPPTGDLRLSRLEHPPGGRRPSAVGSAQ